ncbi:hypothetical protein ALC57_07786 [Trachymyrmex cornetzi]|uniref:Uncharacterized protein n=1 Tax=Trachymyrmex cornetzi TaxID=471704 RepID=A0A151J7J3_9HYME|nr:hypothetical protein ALC57_07786 [Trachymyrmex cornetzi]
MSLRRSRRLSPDSIRAILCSKEEMDLVRVDKEDLTAEFQAKATTAHPHLQQQERNHRRGKKWLDEWIASKEPDFFIRGPPFFGMRMA